MSERQFSSQQESYPFSHKSRSPESQLIAVAQKNKSRVITKYSQFKKTHFFHFELFFSSKSSFWVTVMRLSALGSVLTKIFKKSQNYCVEKPSQKLKENTELLSWCLGNAPRSPHKTSLTWNVSSDSHKYSNRSSFVADLYLLSLTHTCKSPKEVLFGVWVFMRLSALTQLKQFPNVGNLSSFSITRDYCAIENNDFISRGFEDCCSNCWSSSFTSGWLMLNGFGWAGVGTQRANTLKSQGWVLLNVFLTQWADFPTCCPIP